MARKDALFDAACDRADDILQLYRQFAEKNPVMLLELPSQRIYAYPRVARMGRTQTWPERMRNPGGVGCQGPSQRNSVISRRRESAPASPPAGLRGGVLAPMRSGRDQPLAGRQST